MGMLLARVDKKRPSAHEELLVWLCVLTQKDIHDTALTKKKIKGLKYLYILTPIFVKTTNLYMHRKKSGRLCQQISNTLIPAITSRE